MLYIPIAVMLRASTFFFVAIISALPLSSLAACVIPIGPTVTNIGGVTSLHSYTEGSTICIHEFTRENACVQCRMGYFHECRGGYWRPQAWRACEAQLAVRPKTDGGTSPGASGGTGPRRQPPDQREDKYWTSDPQHRPDRDLCVLLGTCR